jgi:phage regulator Rha-like protein
LVVSPAREKAPQARAVVEAERARSMTLQERRNYVEGFNKLVAALARRHASPEETDKVNELCRQARAELRAEVIRQ